MTTWRRFTPGSGELAAILDPSRAAVLVIDVQNDFGHPNGVMGRAGVSLVDIDPAVDKTQRLIAAARGVGAPVIFVRLETAAARDSRPATDRRKRLGQSDAEDKRVCRKDTWGCDWYRLAPGANDIILSKWRYSSFQDTQLDLQLKALRVDTLIFSGLTTECCVETAVRDGFHLDYAVFVVEDACASYDPDLHQGSLKTMSIHHALILDTGQVEQAWSQGNQRPVEGAAN